MNDVIKDRLWVEVEQKLYVTKEQFFQNLEGWEINPVEIDGQIAFVTLVNGAAFHFLSMGTKHPLSMKLIRPFLQDLIDRHGYATTKTPKEDTRQQRFNVLLGFKVSGEDLYDIHYSIERLRHA